MTILLLVLNLIAFVLSLGADDRLVTALLLWPPGAGFRLWQPLTSAFLHGNLLHLGTNMLGLWMFGRPVERALGSRRFLMLYAAGVASSAACQLLVTALMRQAVPTLGASGALFALLGAFAMLYPNRTILLLFPPIPLPARVFVVMYAVVELLSGTIGLQPGVAHFAHLGGLAGGYALLRHWRLQAQRRGLVEGI